ncbi:MAG: hypothetical protein EA349_13875 [Halomonadaceae bacterium]|nr:MAG: hypothetical protein EA349_13875 [Halomonadaceae bacterium]
MFVQRDQSNRIIAVSQVKQPGFLEELPDDDEELSGFMANSGDTSSVFKKSDIELIRVIEDLVDILTQKGVFQYTELPVEVRNKLNSRKALRRERNKLDLLDSNDDDLPWP